MTLLISLLWRSRRCCCCCAVDWKENEEEWVKSFLHSFVSSFSTQRNTKTMSCCPKGSLGHLAPSEGYVQKGTVVRVDDLDLYVVGEGETAIIVVYDIFGFNGGRVRQVPPSLSGGACVADGRNVA